MKPRIRVCLVIGLYPPDFTGWGIQIELLRPHLARVGVDVEVVTRRPLADVSREWRDAGPVHRLLPSDHRHGLRTPFAARALHRHVRDGGYDIFHNTMKGWELHLSLPGIARLGLPVVHEMVLYGSDDPVSNGRERLGGLKLAGLRRSVDAWVGIAEVFRASMARAGVSPFRFHCIYPGVDITTYRPPGPERRAALRSELGIPPDAFVVLSVGSVIPRKGFDRLLEAWAIMGPRRGHDLLLIVGPSSPEEGLREDATEHAAALRARAEAPDLAGTVRLEGRSDTVQDYMAAADVFALLSRREGFGIVIAEAMASGLPVVVSPLDGIAAEIIDVGETGYIVPPPPDEAGLRLRALRESQSLRAGMGRRGRAVAVERFSMARRAERLRALYLSLLGRRPRGGDGVSPHTAP